MVGWRVPKAWVPAPIPAFSLGLRPSNTDHKFGRTEFSGRHICSGLLMQQNRAAMLLETALGELIPRTIRGGTCF